MRTRKHENNAGQICPCYGRVTGKCHASVAADYAASYKKGVKVSTRNPKKGENPDKSRVFGQVKDKMKLGIVESEPVSETLRKRTNADKA